MPQIAESTGAQLAILFASWSVVTGGIWKLFERIEKVASASFKKQMATRLEQAKLDEPVVAMASLFAHSFDSVFGAKHWSWKCFYRSAFVSVIVFAALILLWLAIHPDEAEDTFGADARWLPAFVAVMNIVPDYLSLLKTRHVIRWIGHARGIYANLILLGDAIVSGLIGFVMLAFLDYVADVVLSAFVLGGSTPSYARSAIVVAHNFWRVLTLHTTNYVELPVGAFWYATLFTSVWAWLYSASASILSVAKPLSRGWQVAARLIDIEKQPFLSLGVVSILIVTCSYLIAVPFVLF